MGSEPPEFEVDYTADDEETPESGGSFRPRLTILFLMFVKLQRHIGARAYRQERRNRPAGSNPFD